MKEKNFNSKTDRTNKSFSSEKAASWPRNNVNVHTSPFYHDTNQALLQRFLTPFQSDSIYTFAK